MRLAHLILVHNNPAQLERLLKKMIYSCSDVYIHVDKKSNLTPFEYLKLLPNVYFIKNRKSVGWGNYSMVEATLISMQEILDTQIEYSHINLLSGQDYLLKRMDEIEAFYFVNPEKSFMAYLSINEEWQDAKKRLIKYNLGDLSLPFKFAAQIIVNAFLPNRKIPQNLKPYGRSQWITITPACILYVIEFLRKQPAVLNFFKWTWAVDEIIFQTILLNSPLKETIVNDNKRYIKFENNELNPKILTIADADTLMQSGKFFARKFSIQKDSQILDFIDNALGQ
jgi:hypothetical protein